MVRRAYAADAVAPSRRSRWIGPLRTPVRRAVIRVTASDLRGSRRAICARVLPVTDVATDTDVALVDGCLDHRSNRDRSPE
jgi:hypothetical protein